MEYHVPVLLKESIEGLNIKPDGVYVDVTYGGGGHSREILKNLTTGKLIAFDQDYDAQANVIENENLIFVKANFRFLANYVRSLGFKKIDGLLADLGVSSHHFDAEERGFSFRYKGKLDMRMNQDDEFSAEELLNTYEVNQLALVFTKYGEIKNSMKLSHKIVEYRENKRISSIEEFIELIGDCIPKFSEHKYLAKVFQAIRMEVNGELDVLEEMLLQTTNIIKEDGRLVVITYHSLEDRLVKNFIKKGKFKGEIEKDFYGNTTVPFDAINRKVILPTPEEIEVNNRARSAKLRIAKRN